MLQKKNIENIKEVINIAKKYPFERWKIFNFLPLRGKARENEEDFIINDNQYQELIKYIKKQKNICKVEECKEEEIQLNYLLINPTGDFLITENKEDKVTVDDVTRDKANKYKLIPGQRYEKDPVIHVDSTSESCWVFVKVINDIEKFEVGTTISAQILANNWLPVDDYDNVYYQVYDADQTNPDTDLEVFQEFKLADKAESIPGWGDINEETTITVTGYAVQKEGFAEAIDAWKATFGDKT